MQRGEHEDAQRIRAALCDPFALCDALGIIPEGGRGRVWFRDSATALRIPCPWHQEKTGSCAVSVGADRTVRVRCFGCGATGDALSLVAAVHGIDVRQGFGRVLEIAAQLAGVEGPTNRPQGGAAAPSRPLHPPPRRAQSPPVPTVPRAPRPAPRAEEPEALAPGTFDAIAQVLRERCSVEDLRAGRRSVEGAAEALAYLRDRCIDRGRALGWFVLPASWGALDVIGDAICEAVGRDAWVASGLAARKGPRAGRFLPKWRGRLVIPWHAPNGAVETFQGRAIGEPREGEGKYEGPAGRSPAWPWGVEQLEEHAGADTAVAYVEGAVDALSFDALAQGAGEDCIALGIPGAQNWRPAWARIARGRRAVVALDADRGGREARDGIVADLLREAASVEIREPGEGKDWNDALRAIRARRGAA